MENQYLTLVARGVSTRKVFVMASSFLGLQPSELWPVTNSRHSTRSQIHDRNRDRIVLHVILNDSSNRTRC